MVVTYARVKDVEMQVAGIEMRLHGQYLAAGLPLDDRLEFRRGLPGEVFDPLRFATFSGGENRIRPPRGTRHHQPLNAVCFGFLPSFAGLAFGVIDLAQIPGLFRLPSIHLLDEGVAVPFNQPAGLPVYAEIHPTA